MSGEIIRQGDSTSHNGKVLEGSLTDICMGKPIAYIGHKVSCPQCKGTYPIIEGVLTTTFYGKGVAIAGMKTSCGAVLIPSQFSDVVEIGSGRSSSSASARGEGGAPASASATAIAATAIAATSAAASLVQEKKSEAAKKVTRLFWSYGDEETPVSEKSRFYVDLNLHVETENYANGEAVDIVLENDDGDDVTTGSKSLTLQAIVGAGGKATIKNVFARKTVDITHSVA